MMKPPLNIFSGIPRSSQEELFGDLLETPHCQIERIVSFGQASPEGFWYNQAWDEWVLLIQGTAELDLAGKTVALVPGDHLLIPAGCRHRVNRTDHEQPTIWLAIHINKNPVD